MYYFYIRKFICFAYFNRLSYYCIDKSKYKRMGLFDFFKKKKNVKIVEDKNSNRVLLAMPLFKNNESYDIQKVIIHLKDYWKLDITDLDSVNNETAAFYINGLMVAIAAMDVPVPADEIESVAGYNYMWPEAVYELKDCTGHAIVTVLSSDKPAVEKHFILSKLLCSILMTSNCVGIYQGTETLLMQPDYYLNCLDYLKDGDIPVPIWIYIGVRRNDNNETSLYTFGLTGFDKYEMEIIDSKEDVNELYDLLLNTSAYIIGQDVTLRNGETIGVSVEQKLPITLSEGVNVEGITFKINI